MLTNTALAIPQIPGDGNYVLNSDIQQIQNQFLQPPLPCQPIIRLLYGQDSNNVMIVMLNISYIWENVCLLRRTAGSA